MIGASIDADRDAARQSRSLLVREVLPALRERVGGGAPEQVGPAFG